jgi:hypothetical protein
MSQKSQYDPFDVMKPAPALPGVVTIGHVNRFTGDVIYKSFNALYEKHAASENPFAAIFFIMLMADRGFRIQHTNAALQAFFTAAMAPQDHEIHVEPLPAGVFVESIETKMAVEMSRRKILFRPDFFNLFLADSGSASSHPSKPKRS